MLGICELFIGFLLRLIRFTNHTTEKLERYKAVTADEMRQFYAGVSGPQQWEMGSVEKPTESKITLDDKEIHFH
jgi:hypothetical protein